jgi:hypothetical protein
MNQQVEFLSGGGETCETCRCIGIPGLNSCWTGFLSRYLWHGQVFQAWKRLDGLPMDVKSAAFETKDENRLETSAADRRAAQLCGATIRRSGQVRTHVLNEEWQDIFRRWHPGFRPRSEEQLVKKAALIP